MGASAEISDVLRVAHHFGLRQASVFPGAQERAVPPPGLSCPLALPRGPAPLWAGPWGPSRPQGRWVEALPLEACLGR